MFLHRLDQEKWPTIYNLEGEQRPKIGPPLMRKFFHLFKINGNKIRPSSEKLIRLNLARGRNQNERRGRYSNACIFSSFRLLSRPVVQETQMMVVSSYHYVLRVMDCNWHRRVTASKETKGGR